MGRSAIVALMFTGVAATAADSGAASPQTWSTSAAQAGQLPAFGARELVRPPVDERIRIDQFGYREAGAKVAVLSSPAVGAGAPAPYPSPDQLEVRRLSDGATVFTGPAVAWRGGALHAQSGDRAFQFDFGTLTARGRYYVYDPGTGLRSHAFRIADEVHAPVLDQAVRTFYYQRCGAAKLAEHAGADWADGACHVGPGQDLDCRWVLNPTAASARDLSGGWHDAGDYNKYVNFADGPLHELLFAATESPAAFGDDLDLPESGNGLADLLDEVKVELDWFLKMQEDDGSVLHKVSVTSFVGASPPSADTAVRRYAEPTASATISACGAFAHGALVFGAQPGQAAYAATLRAAAEDAWAWLEANPGAIPSSYDNAGFVNVSAEDDPYRQATNRLCAAVYLFALTGAPAYRTWVDQNYQSAHLIQWGFAYPFEAEFQDALLFYALAPGATPSVVAAIQAAYVGSVAGPDNLQHALDGDDPYRAHLDDQNYVWGVTSVKASQGGLYANMLAYGLDPANATAYREAAAGYVHWTHGVNPLGLALLTNMDEHGAEASLRSIYHGWFADGTDWDDALLSPFGPAPGFLPGGPNPSFAPDPAYTGPPLEPPMGQPIQKSYRDWNADWPENSWEVTENSITYQSSYIKLLASTLD